MDDIVHQDFVSFSRFHFPLELVPLSDDSINQARQEPPLSLHTVFLRQRSYLFLLLLLHIHLLPSLKVFGQGSHRSVDFTKTDIVLSDDAGVQAVEVEEQYIFGVEPLLWLQDQTSSIFLLLFDLCWLLLFLFFIVLVLVLVEFVRNQQPLLLAFMHNQKLISLCTCIVKTSPPDIAANVGELFGQLDDFQVVHQVESPL